MSDGPSMGQTQTSSPAGVTQRPIPAESSFMLQGYTPAPGRYDELIDGSGNLREHWRWLMDAFQKHDAHGQKRLRRDAAKMVRDNGITYNVYNNSSHGTDRPWELDLLPLVISAQDWAFVESGVQQRIRLLNLIMRDLYGARNLIRQGVVPPEIVFANPQFERTCDGLPFPAAGAIARYGADLVRKADGSWCVLSDRTQAPAGGGYALENRIVIARTFPDLIAQGEVRRHASFFSEFRAMLKQMAPEPEGDASLALLSPGPQDEIYFEHVFLARYMGMEMVQGEDCTIRENNLYLRTIAGLRRVDVLLRRVIDKNCDPLELNRESKTGIVGLLQAVRGGTVATCNALGAGAVECPMMAAVMDRLCEFYLGEKLILPSVQTWWGADADHRAHIEANFDSLHIRPAFDPWPKLSKQTSDLDPESREALHRDWQRQPYNYVGVEIPETATVPVWESDRLAPRSYSLRTYAVSGLDPEHPKVMPGGLARFMDGDGQVSADIQQGDGTKDVWVVADKPEEYRSLLQSQKQILSVVRSPKNLSSRRAENLLWLGRYCERTECNVRLMRHILMRCLDEEDIIGAEEILGLAGAAKHLFTRETLESIESTCAEFGGDKDEFRTARYALRAAYLLRNSVFDSVFNEDRPDTVTRTITALRKAAWVVREHFSDDDWRILNGFTHEFLSQRQSMAHPDIAATVLALNRIVTGLAAFSGMVQENMTREPGRIFIELGRRIERTGFLARLLRQLTSGPLGDQPAILRTALAICDSSMTYRARYGSIYELPLVLDLLVVDRTNPRSLSFQLQALEELLAQLPKGSESAVVLEETRLAALLSSETNNADVFYLSEVDEKGKRKKLQEFFKRASDQMDALYNALARHYFIHVTLERQIEKIVEPPIE